MGRSIGQTVAHGERRQDRLGERPDRQGVDHRAGADRNVIVIGLAVEAALAVIPAAGPMWARIAMLIAERRLSLPLSGSATQKLSVNSSPSGAKFIK